MLVSQLLVAAFVAGNALSASARDFGQYSNSPQQLREWFDSLQNPQTGSRCCSEADCARTEARTRGGKLEAKAPDGAWIAVPPESIVVDQGNPTGEPILCSHPSEEGDSLQVRCFVPGPDG